MKKKYVVLFDGEPIAVRATKEGAHDSAISHSMYYDIVDQSRYSVHEVKYIDS